MNKKHKVKLNVRNIKKENKSREKMVNRIANFLEMPEELLGQNAKITLVDNKYLYLEGSNQIEDYYGYYIKIKTKKHVITIDGKNMEIREMNDSELCIEGQIISVTYENRGV